MVLITELLPIEGHLHCALAGPYSFCSVCVRLQRRLELVYVRELNHAPVFTDTLTDSGFSIEVCKLRTSPAGKNRLFFQLFRGKVRYRVSNKLFSGDYPGTVIAKTCPEVC